MLSLLFFLAGVIDDKSLAAENPAPLKAPESNQRVPTGTPILLLFQTKSFTIKARGGRLIQAAKIGDIVEVEETIAPLTREVVGAVDARRREAVAIGTVEGVGVNALCLGVEVPRPVDPDGVVLIDDEPFGSAVIEILFVFTRAWIDPNEAVAAL